MEIIGVPEWDLFMMVMIDGSGHHRISIGPHLLCNGCPCTSLSIECMRVFVLSVEGAFLQPTLWGLPLCVFGRT